MPTLYLDGSAVVNGSPSSKGAQVGIGLSVNIPWATFANQSLTQFVGAQTNQNGGNGGYIVQTGWDQVGRGMIEKHRKLLHQAINSGAAANSELALGESLVVLGYTWLAECAAQQRLSDQLLGTATQYFYGGGIVGMAVGTTISSPYVDLPLNFINSPARVNGSGAQTPNSIAAFLDGSGTSSSFESTSLEQTQASVPGFVAASTVKLLDIATQNGDTIFDISSPQVYNTIRPQLVPNYAAGNLATIDNYVAQGFRVIAPLHGRIPIGSWTGVGFKTMLQSGNAFSYGEIISGGLSGGFGGVNDPPVFFIVNADGSMTPVLERTRIQRTWRQRKCGRSDRSPEGIVSVHAHRPGGRRQRFSLRAELRTVLRLRRTRHSQARWARVGHTTSPSQPQLAATALPVWERAPRSMQSARL